MERVTELPFKLEIIKVEKKKEILMNEWNINVHETTHWGSIKVDGRITAIDDGTFSQCYIINHKGTKIGISGDTGDVPILREIAPSLDCLIIESTFSDDSCNAFTHNKGNFR